MAVMVGSVDKVHVNDLTFGVDSLSFGYERIASFVERCIVVAVIDDTTEASSSFGVGTGGAVFFGRKSISSASPLSILSRSIINN